jgi:hypothetical protein
MSTLSQFSGGGVKSIQRGTVSNITTTTTVTISSVDTSKAIVLVSFQNGASFNGSAGFASSASAALTSSTQLTVKSGYTATVLGYPSIDWQVVEYY